MKWFSGDITEHLFKKISSEEKDLVSKDIPLSKAVSMAQGRQLESKYTLEEAVDEFLKLTCFAEKSCSKLMSCFELDNEEQKETIALKFNKLSMPDGSDPSGEQLAQFYAGKAELCPKAVVCSFKECSIKSISKSKMLSEINRLNKKIK